MSFVCPNCGGPEGYPSGHAVGCHIGWQERQSIATVEAEYKQTVVAIALNEDGTIYDHCFNWETAQNMALSEGYAVKAIADDGSMTKDRIQALCDAEKARHDDCFGITVMPEEHDEVEEGRRERREFYRNRDY